MESVTSSQPSDHGNAVSNPVLRPGLGPQCVAQPAQMPFHGQGMQYSSQYRPQQGMRLQHMGMYDASQRPYDANLDKNARPCQANAYPRTMQTMPNQGHMDYHSTAKFQGEPSYEQCSTPQTPYKSVPQHQYPPNIHNIQGAGIVQTVNPTTGKLQQGQFVLNAIGMPGNTGNSFQGNMHNVQMVGQTSGQDGGSYQFNVAANVNVINQPVNNAAAAAAPQSMQSPLSTKVQTFPMSGGQVAYQKQFQSGIDVNLNDELKPSPAALASTRPDAAFAANMVTSDAGPQSAQMYPQRNITASAGNNSTLQKTSSSSLTLNVVTTATINRVASNVSAVQTTSAHCAPVTCIPKAQTVLATSDPVPEPIMNCQQQQGAAGQMDIQTAIAILKQAGLGHLINQSSEAISKVLAQSGGEVIPPAVTVATVTPPSMQHTKISTVAPPLCQQQQSTADALQLPGQKVYVQPRPSAMTLATSDLAPVQPAPLVAKVPFGWRRVIEAGVVAYYSPSSVRLASRQSVLQYITSDNTCKCGLECPLVIDRLFNFDPLVESRCWTPSDVRDDATKLCNHKRRIEAMAAFRDQQTLPYGGATEATGAAAGAEDGADPTKKGKKKRLKQKSASEDSEPLGVQGNILKSGVKVTQSPKAKVKEGRTDSENPDVLQKVESILAQAQQARREQEEQEGGSKSSRNKDIAKGTKLKDPKMETADAAATTPVTSQQHVAVPQPPATASAATSCNNARMLQPRGMPHTVMEPSMRPPYASFCRGSGVPCPRVSPHHPSPPIRAPPHHRQISPRMHRFSSPAAMPMMSPPPPEMTPHAMMMSPPAAGMYHHPADGGQFPQQPPADCFMRNMQHHMMPPRGPPPDATSQGPRMPSPDGRVMMSPPEFLQHYGPHQQGTAPMSRFPCQMQPAWQQQHGITSQQMETDTDRDTASGDPLKTAETKNTESALSAQSPSDRASSVPPSVTSESFETSRTIRPQSTEAAPVFQGETKVKDEERSQCSVEIKSETFTPYPSEVKTEQHSYDVSSCVPPQFSPSSRQPRPDMFRMDGGQYGPAPHMMPSGALPTHRFRGRLRGPPSAMPPFRPSHDIGQQYGGFPPRGATRFPAADFMPPGGVRPVREGFMASRMLHAAAVRGGVPGSEQMGPFVPGHPVQSQGQMGPHKVMTPMGSPDFAEQIPDINSDFSGHQGLPGHHHRFRFPSSQEHFMPNAPPGGSRPMFYPPPQQHPRMRLVGPPIRGPRGELLAPTSDPMMSPEMMLRGAPPGGPIGPCIRPGPGPIRPVRDPTPIQLVQNMVSGLDQSQLDPLMSTRRENEATQQLLQRRPSLSSSDGPTRPPSGCASEDTEPTPRVLTPAARPTAPARPAAPKSALLAALQSGPSHEAPTLEMLVRRPNSTKSTASERSAGCSSDVTSETSSQAATSESTTVKTDDTDVESKSQDGEGETARDSAGSVTTSSSDVTTSSRDSTPAPRSKAALRIDADAARSIAQAAKDYLSSVPERKAVRPSAASEGDDVTTGLSGLDSAMKDQVVNEQHPSGASEEAKRGLAVKAPAVTSASSQRSETDVMASISAVTSEAIQQEERLAQELQKDLPGLNVHEQHNPLFHDVTEQQRFLTTLPPSTLQLLSQVQVTNPIFAQQMLMTLMQRPNTAASQADNVKISPKAKVRRTSAKKDHQQGAPQHQMKHLDEVFNAVVYSQPKLADDVTAAPSGAENVVKVDIKEETEIEETSAAPNSSAEVYSDECKVPQASLPLDDIAPVGDSPIQQDECSDRAMERGEIPNPANLTNAMVAVIKAEGTRDVISPETIEPVTTECKLEMDESKQKLEPATFTAEEITSVSKDTAPVHPLHLQEPYHTGIAADISDHVLDLSKNGDADEDVSTAEDDENVLDLSISRSGEPAVLNLSTRSDDKMAVDHAASDNKPAVSVVAAASTSGPAVDESYGYDEDDDDADYYDGHFVDEGHHYPKGYGVGYNGHYYEDEDYATAYEDANDENYRPVVPVHSSNEDGALPQIPPPHRPTTLERIQRGLKRRIGDLQVEGFPDLEVSNDEFEEEESASVSTLPPRQFRLGELVWGATRGCPSWPGMLVKHTDVKGHNGALDKDKVWVRWFGDHSFSQVEPAALKTMTEGLEAHHRAVKRQRKGRRMNSSLEAAIQEAMNELDLRPDSATT